MKISRMLPLLEDMEGSVAELYKKYAAMFRHDDEASSLFDALSEEELVHKEIMGHIRLVQMKNPETFHDVDADLDLVSEALGKVKGAAASERPIPVEDGVSFALMVEVMFTEWYDVSAVTESDPRHAEFMRIFLESQGHLKKLVDFAEERGWFYDITPEGVKARLSL